MTINEYVVMEKHKPSRDRSCQPADGKTYLTIGQDYFSIQEYVSSQYNASLHQGSTAPMTSFQPAATMFYTDIQTLRGLDTPIDYGSGIEYADGLAQGLVGSGIQIGLWLNGTAGCQDILDGVLDDKLHQMFHYLKHVPVPKIFLRVGYEFDNPSFGYSDSPGTYKRAFRKIVKSCEQYDSPSHCHRKVAFVWHSWAAPRVVEDLDDFYPGDKYVDWVGISIFQQLYPWAMDDNDSSVGEFAGGTMRQVHDVLEFAQGHNKPVMISESTPFGGIDLKDVVGDAAQEYLKNGDNDVDVVDAWDLWFQPTLDLIETYDIAMWSYINCDWNSQPMWKGIGFGNTLLSSSENVMTKWRQQVLDNPRFLTNLDCDRHHHHHHHNSRSSPTSSSSRLMVWNEGVAGFFVPFLWFALAAVVIAGLLHWIWQLLLKKEDEEYGYIDVPDVDEEEEEEGLKQIRRRFGSSTRLDAKAEELAQSSRSSYTS